MINNAAGVRLVGGALGGLLGFGVTWLLAEPAGPLLWGGARYGVGVGVGATVLYVVCGGRTLAGAAAAAALGSSLSLLALFAYLIASEAGDGALGDLVLGAVLVFVYWGVPLGLLLLLLPAVTTALVLGGVAALAARLAARTPE